MPQNRALCEMILRLAFAFHKGLLNHEDRRAGEPGREMGTWTSTKWMNIRVPRIAPSLHMERRGDWVAEDVIAVNDPAAGPVTTPEEVMCTGQAGSSSAPAA